MSGPRRTSLLVLLSLLLTGGLLVPGTISSALFAAVAVAFPVALIALGAHDPGRGGQGPDRRLAGALVALLVILELSVFGVLSLSAGPDEGTATLGGLPVAAFVQIVGLWLLPLPLVVLTYAVTFDRSGIRRDDLESLRRRFGGRGGADRGET